MLVSIVTHGFNVWKGDRIILCRSMKARWLRFKLNLVDVSMKIKIIVENSNNRHLSNLLFREITIRGILIKENNYLGNLYSRKWLFGQIIIRKNDRSDNVIQGNNGKPILSVYDINSEKIIIYQVWYHDCNTYI